MDTVTVNALPSPRETDYTNCVVKLRWLLISVPLLLSFLLLCSYLSTSKAIHVLMWTTENKLVSQNLFRHMNQPRYQTWSDETCDSILLQFSRSRLSVTPLPTLFSACGRPQWPWYMFLPLLLPVKCHENASTYFKQTSPCVCWSLNELVCSSG